MPDVAAGEAGEGHDDSRDHAGVGSDGILPAGLIRVGRLWRAQEVQLTLGLIEPGLVGLAVEDLEAHQVQMNGMGIVGGIDQGPDFGRAQHRLFRDRHTPMRSIQQQFYGIAGLVDIFVERKQTGLHGLRFGNFGYRPLEQTGSVLVSATFFSRDAELHDHKSVSS